jgi:uncharacterized protein (TIRG00374 family)
MRRRPVRVLATTVVTGLCIAYLIWKVDISQAVREIAEANYLYLLLSLVIMAVTVVPMAWRWQRLLRAKRIEERLPWLTRSYYVSYAAGQILPTSIGGDAMRIFEASRRHSGVGGTIAGTVLLERALGGTATLLLAAVGFVLAYGHYDVGAYLWIEAAFVLGTLVAGVVLFSRTARRPLARLAPLLRRLWLERPVRAVYEGIHSYRSNAGLLVGVLALTIVVQAFRVLAIWLAGKSVGVDLSPRPYYVMGPLLFLVILIPFTINGLAVRESFFVSFLGQLGVDSDAAFATGFLFFLVTLALSVPGALILAWEGMRRAARPTTPDMSTGQAPRRG